MISRRDFLKILGIGSAIVAGLSQCSKIEEYFYPTHHYYFPGVFNNGNFSGVLGLQVDGSVLGYEKFIVSHKVYQSPLRWTDAEEVRGKYIFPAWLDHNVEVFKSVDADLILGIKTCPEWARLWKDKQGSPPLPEFYGACAEFIRAGIERYKPKAIAFCNEPDVDKDLVSDAIQYWFGAWVINGDYYGAGRRYGEAFNYIYSKLKPLYPNTLFIAGELIGERTSLEFLSGMLSVNLKADYISYHKYIHNKTQFNALFDFANEIKKLTSIPLIITETNIVSDIGGDIHEQLKADYVKHIYDRIGWEEIELVEFYSLDNSWRNTPFCPNKVPTPAYDVWKDL